MRQRIDVMPDAPGGAPLWRARSLTLTPVQVAWGAESRTDEGPKRPARHERVAEDGHQRGR